MITDTRPDPDYLRRDPRTDPGSELSLPILGRRLDLGRAEPRAARHPRLRRRRPPARRRVAARSAPRCTAAQLTQELETRFATTLGVLADALETKDAYTADHANEVADLAITDRPRPRPRRRRARPPPLLRPAARHRQDRRPLATSSPSPAADPRGVRGDQGALRRSAPRMLQRIPLPAAGRAARPRRPRALRRRRLPRRPRTAMRSPAARRIVAVCDALHAMTSDRPYRRATADRRRAGRAAPLRRHPVRPRRGRRGGRRSGGHGRLGRHGATRPGARCGRRLRPSRPPLLAHQQQRGHQRHQDPRPATTCRHWRTRRPADPRTARAPRSAACRPTAPSAPPPPATAPTFDCSEFSSTTVSTATPSDPPTRCKTFNIGVARGTCRGAVERRVGRGHRRHHRRAQAEAAHEQRRHQDASTTCRRRSNAYGTVPSARITSPTGTTRPGADAIGQPAADVHPDRRAEPLRRHQQPGVQRRLRRARPGSTAAAGSSSRTARAPIRNDRRRGGAEAAPAEQPHLDERVLDAQRAHDERGDQRQRPRRSASTRSAPSACRASPTSLRPKTTAATPGDSSSKPDACPAAASRARPPTRAPRRAPAAAACRPARGPTSRSAR